jgi:hypothetical protein
VPCGDKYKAVLQRMRAPGAMSSNEQRRKLLQALNHIRRPPGACVCHSSAASAACDHVHTPRELLPRLYSSSSNPDAFPYVSQATFDDVRAMRLLRSSSNNKGKHLALLQSRAVLQQRLEQYASTGAGTVAEAIVYNDCFCLGHLAHEQLSAANSALNVSRRKSLQPMKLANFGVDSSYSISTSSGADGTSSSSSSSSSSSMNSSSSSSVTTADNSSVTPICSGSSSAAAAADVAATDKYGTISSDTAVTYDTTQMYSMAPLQHKCK